MPVASKPRTPKPLTQIPIAWDGEILMTTVRGAADLMGVGVTTVRYWIRRGMVTGARRHPSGRVWIPVVGLWRDAVPAALQQQIENMRAGLPGGEQT